MTDRTADAGRRGVTGGAKPPPPASTAASRRRALALGVAVAGGGGSRALVRVRQEQMGAPLGRKGQAGVVWTHANFPTFTFLLTAGW